MPTCKGLTGCKTGLRPCPNTAKKDGFCRLHHPDTRMPPIERKEKRLVALLDDVRTELDHYRKQRAAIPGANEEDLTA